MLCADVSILVAAHRAEHVHHELVRRDLVDYVTEHRVIALASVVVSGFVRIVTNPRIFNTPSTQRQAFDFLDVLWEKYRLIPVEPGQAHAVIFRDLCERSGAVGNLVTDAYIAAIAVEHGARIWSIDRDFAKFPGLEFRHPLDDDPGA